jgi:hypothetical protein
VPRLSTNEVSDRGGAAGYIVERVAPVT